MSQEKTKPFFLQRKGKSDLIRVEKVEVRGMKKDRKIHVLIIIPLLLTLVLFMGITFALYTQTVPTNRTISLTTGTKYIGIYGQNGSDKNKIGLNQTYTFTIENRGVEDSDYELYLKNLTTDIDLSKISYTIEYSDKTYTENLSSLEETGFALLVESLAQGEKLEITLRLTSTEISDYQGKLELKLVDIYNYSYTGSAQTFQAPKAGTYRIEAWGAWAPYINIGGQLGAHGYGGYTSGTISLRKGQVLYIYVGEAGSNTKTGTTFNGGGAGGTGDMVAGSSGGGATDIRLKDGNWDDFESLKSRIMVAGGAGGAADNGTYCNFWVDCTEAFNAGSNAGGILGYNSGTDTGHQAFGYGGTQTVGGNGGANLYNAVGNALSGSFGKGGNNTTISSAAGAGGGGGGYYGGGAGHGGTNGGHGYGGGGGSSFISGHAGCDAIKETSTASNIVHTGQSIHYSGLSFDNTIMLDGMGYQWTNVKTNNRIKSPRTPAQADYYFGNLGPGYARITFLND